jgi:hypothetical protein
MTPDNPPNSSGVDDRRTILTLLTEVLRTISKSYQLILNVGFVLEIGQPVGLILG